VVLTLSLVAGGVLEAAAIGAILPLIAVLSRPNPASIHPVIGWAHRVVGEPDRQRFMIYSVGVVVILFVLKSLVLGIMYWFQKNYAFRIRERLANQLMRHYLGQPYTFHLQNNSITLVNNVMVESSHVATLTSQYFVIATEVVVLIAILLVLVIADPVAAIVAVIASSGMGYLFTKLTRDRLARWGCERREHEIARRLEAQHVFGAFKEIEVLGRKKNFVGKFETGTHGTLQAYRNLEFVATLPRLWLEPMAMIGLLILTLWLILNGRPFSSLLPVLAVFAAAGVRLMPSISRVVAAVQVLNFMQPALIGIRQEISAIRNRTQSLDVAEAESVKTVDRVRNIEFKSVTHRYVESNDRGLTEVNFRVEEGSSVGIIGRTGAGKTTMIDLILGLLKPLDGQVLVNGNNINDDLAAWRSTVGYVPQHIFLIDDSIRNNVALGIAADEINEEAVTTALESAQLLEFVESLPDGLDTVVGESGVRLSGGERQRVGIARALYHDPEVLIFDEATSALDRETERRFVETVKQMYGKKTIFIIAHRSSAIDGVSQVFEISGGKLVAFDSDAIIQAGDRD